MYGFILVDLTDAEAILRGTQGSVKMLVGFYYEYANMVQCQTVFFFLSVKTKFES